MIRSTASQLARSAYLLCEPIGLVWLALIAFAVALWWRRQRGFAAAAGVLALFILAVGGSDLPDALLRSLERPYVGVEVGELPVCDAVVVLGGGIEPSLHEVAHLHLTPAGDRIVAALELVRLGKAPALCIGGSSVVIAGQQLIESEVVKEAILERKLTGAEVIALGRCANTCDEARRVRDLVQARGWRRVLLVTSASHLRRAVATFRTAGVEVVPVPCNFLGFNGHPSGSWWLTAPSHGGFVQTSTWMREVVGWYIYRARGYIE